MEIQKISTLQDNKINSASTMTTMKIGDYLELTSLEDNKYQRSLQRLSFYEKLISDLLQDGVMPPISIVNTSEQISFEENASFDSSKKFLILDGLQRTNCLHECIRKINNKEAQDSKFKTEEEFREKKIYVEIWDKMDFDKLLYKMIVLNTGQKKMDYSHQLSILSTSIKDKLDADGISYKENPLEGADEKSLLSIVTITEGLASLINASPLKSKANAAEFLFNRFNHSDEDSSKSLDLISSESTYNILKWSVSELNDQLNKKYVAKNPFIDNDIFYISFMAALGFAYNKLGAEKFETSKEELLKKIEVTDDFLDITNFEYYYNKFTTGIGAKKRKLVFDAFRDYLTRGGDKIDWRTAYDLI